MIINHNMPALNTYNRLSNNNTQTNKSLEKLSSGLRINRAGDDAAGLAISEKMRGQIRGLDQAQRNAQDSISMIQTAEGALNETHSILQRMRELAVQASNDTNTKVDRGEIQKEINQLTDEIDRIANTTEFNTQKLLDGSKKGQIDAEDGQAALQNNSKATINLANTTANETAIKAVDQSDVVIITKGVVSGQATVSIDGSTYSVYHQGGTTAFDATSDLTGTTVALGGQTIAFDNIGVLADGESITITTKAAIASSSSVGNSFAMQIGANSGQNIMVGINSMKASDLKLRDNNGDATDNGVNKGALNVGNHYKASAAITIINNAIESVSAERSKMGAVQNRLEHTINNLNTSSENLTAAESRVRDVDMAKEMMNFQKNNILSQAAQAMLAQANQQPQGVLQLLR
ncbi:flagellin [Sporomusa sp. GT1]|uniref:flagellin N-terminal helical domain-containing protein n=1 Tax=Sporomusa sp. GT1 TaxID=1534747 RepID=UPI0016679366|nr:flagellin [Sporomusa sp. GT1]